MRAYMGSSAAEIDCSFDIAGGDNALKDAIQRVRRQAEDAVREGATHLILSDAAVGPSRAAIPMILATGAVHVHLLRQQLRTFTSLNVRSGECLDVHHFAVLIGVGATTVNAYVAEASIEDRRQRGLFGKLSLDECLERYRSAVDQGLLKVMSKMGISVISSYRGGANFEALGLSRTLVAEYFPAMPSRISGIGMIGIQKRVMDLHARAWSEDFAALPIGGFYKYRRGGETHAWAPDLIHMLQSAVASESYQTFKKYSEAVHKLPPVAIRDLLDFVPTGKSISVDEVESITEIRKRFVTPGMSLGALGPEAHRTLGIAMNRIGAKSDSGEGGEDPPALQAAGQRRQREFGDQTGCQRAFRRDRRLPEQLPGTRDQDGAGRQTRRGRSVAGLQGDRGDRQAAPCHRGRIADLAAAASRHLFDRGSRAADLRP